MNDDQHALRRQSRLLNTGPWEIQSFPGYANGLAHSSVGCEDLGELVIQVMDLPESDADAWLIRRGPQVESADGLIGPYRLVPLDARDRLARHLYVDSGSAAFFWDQRQVDRAPWLAKAATILDIIAGKEA